MIDFITILFLGLLLGFSLTVLIFGERTDKVEAKLSKKSEEMLFNELRKQIDLGVVKNLEDVALIQRSIAEKEKFSFFASKELAPLLECYLLQVTSSSSSKKKKEHFYFIKSLIDQARTEKPFSILPDKERALAITLKESIESKDKKASSERLEELVTSLGVKLQSANEEREKTRRWTRISAVAGVGGIVVAGIIFLTTFF